MSPPRRRRRVFLAFPAVAYAALILYLSSRPAADLPSTGVPSGDKLLHVVEYFVYGLLLLLPTYDLAWRGTTVSFAVGIMYAGFDEAVQSTVPGRFADAADLAFDVLGLFLAVVVVTIVRARTAAKPA